MYSLRSKIVLAVCAAMSCGAYAGGVTIGGALDAGLSVSHTKAGTSYKETTGNLHENEIAVRGEETIGGLHAGFNLTTGFDLNSGALEDDGKRIFSHESQVYLGGDWGRVGLGRVGSFSSAAGSLGWFADYDAFSGGFGEAGLQASQHNLKSRYSNSAYYQSPVINGFQAGLFYSISGSKTDEQADRFKDNEGYWNAALRWNSEKAGTIMSFEGTRSPSGSSMKDGFIVKASAKYDFGPLTLMGGYSHGEHQQTYAFDTHKSNDDYMALAAGEREKGIRTDSAYIGMQIPYGNTEFNVQYQYLDGKNQDISEKFHRHVVAAGLEHHLSKRTSLYGVGSYSHGHGVLSSANDPEANAVRLHVGLSHTF